MFKLYKYLFLSILIFLSILKSNEIQINKGWNLIGSKYYIENINEVFQNSKLIWKYKDNEWLATSPQIKYTNKIKELNITNFTSIKEGEGFWVYSDINETILIPETNQTTDILNINKGWNLVSLLNIKQNNILSFKNKNIKYIWKWKNNNWKTFSPLPELYNKILSSNSILKNIDTFEGFWVYSEESFSLDSNGNIIENDNNSPVINLYVSNNNLQEGIGTFENPFNRIEDAIITSNNYKSNKVNIYLREGNYYLKDSIKLTKEYNRTKDYPLTISGYKDENITLYGSKIISKWDKLETNDTLYNLISSNIVSHIYVSDLNISYLNDAEINAKNYDRGENPIYTNELYINNNKIPISKYPEDRILDFTYIDGNISYSNNSIEDIYEIEKWKEDNNSYIYARWNYDWADDRDKILSIDIDNKILKLNNKTAYGYKSDSTQSSQIGFYGFNLISSLKENSYYIDYNNSKIYYFPNNIDNNVSISYLTDIINITEASNIYIKNMNFTESIRNALNIQNSSNIIISNCNFFNTGGTAIYMEDTPFSIIENNRIFSIGGAGIQVKAGDRNTLTNGNIIITNNEIFDTSKTIKYYSSGIKVYGVGNVVYNNKIYNLPHIAIYFNGNNNLFKSNTINNVVRNANDAGAIYAGQDWSQRGNVIEENIIYDVMGEGDKKGATAIYLDDSFSGTNVKNNIIFNTYRAILIGGGRDNIIDNNIIANTIAGVHVDDRVLNVYSTIEDSKIHLGYKLEQVPWKSELWKNAYPSLFTIYEGDPRIPEGNKIINNKIIGPSNWWEDYTGVSSEYLYTENNNWIKTDILSIEDIGSLNDYVLYLKEKKD